MTIVVMQIPVTTSLFPHAGDLPVVGGRNLSQLRQQGAIQASGVFHLADFEQRRSRSRGFQRVEFAWVVWYVWWEYHQLRIL